MNKKIKVCLIGAGRIGLFLEKDRKRLKPATHFGMWLKERSVNLSAICDKNYKSYLFAKKLKKNIKYYSSVDKILKEEKPDIVSICTWKDSHFSITKKCINFGIKTIVLEKPLATSVLEGKKLINLAKKHKVKIIVNHRRRFDKEIISLRNKINRNIIGKIKKVSCNYVYGVQATGTHVVDTLRMLFKDTSGEISHVVGIYSDKNDFCAKDDQNIDSIIYFKKGLIAYIQCHNIKDYDIFDFNIFGSKGKITISGIGREVQINKIIKSTEHSGFTELSSKGKYLSSKKPRPMFKELSNNAIQCFKKNAKSMCDEIDSHKALCVLEKIIESAKKNSIKLKVSY